MTAVNKKRKAHNTYLDRSGEKGKIFRLKGECFFHKKERAQNKKVCRDYQPD